MFQLDREAFISILLLVFFALLGHSLMRFLFPLFFGNRRLLLGPPVLQDAVQHLEVFAHTRNAHRRLILMRELHCRPLAQEELYNLSVVIKGSPM